MSEQGSDASTEARDACGSSGEGAGMRSRQEVSILEAGSLWHYRAAEWNCARC